MNKISHGASLFAMCVAAQASVGSKSCPLTPEEAATNFVTLMVEDARRSLTRLNPYDVGTFRASLQQLMDERFSPDSRAFRERIMGSDATVDTIAAASDADVVGAYLGIGEEKRKTWRISGARVTESKRDALGNWVFSVSYHVATPDQARDQSRVLYVSRLEDCWTVGMPIEAWQQLEQIKRSLKASRTDSGVSRQGASRAHLRLAAGSESARPGMKETALRGMNRTAWLAAEPLLTENELERVRVGWDCAAAMGPEEPALTLTFSDDGGNKLHRWTESNQGSMLAIEVNSEVVQFARVAGVFGPKVQICMGDQSLEQAQSLAADLMGAPSPGSN